MDLLKLKFPANSFDAIWAQAVLLHFNKIDAQKIIKNFYKLLKPGGKLHIGLKKGKGIKIIKEKLVDNEERKFTFFTKKEAEQILEKAKFKIISSRIVPDLLSRRDIKWIYVWGEKK